MKTILRALEHHASSQPEKTAITGNSRLNWQQFHAATMAMTTRLDGHRVIGLHMENSPAWIVTDLAAMSAGASLVPLPTFFSDTQLRHAIQDAQIDMIITDNSQRIASIAQVNREAVIDIAGDRYTQIFTNINNEDTGRIGTAKVTYTSGTTGTPQGVRLGPAAIGKVAASLARAAGARDDDRALVLLPLSILLENIGSVYAPILAGAEIIVPEARELGVSGSSRVDIERFSAALHRFRPTTIILTPCLLKLVVSLAECHRLPDSFRFIAVGGAPAGTGLLEKAHTLGLPVFQGYGLSEACSVVAMNTPSDNRPGSVGKPLPGTTVRVAAGGQLLIGGVTADGYLNGTDFTDGAELETGDIGYLDGDGYLYVTGRSSNRIITGFGRNISPEWVESELVSHPFIAQAAVVGEATVGLEAVLVPATGQRSDSLAAALRDVNARLPDYARISRYTVAESSFSAEKGELTPGGAPARNIIGERYAYAISNP